MAFGQPGFVFLFPGALPATPALPQATVKERPSAKPRQGRGARFPRAIRQDRMNGLRPTRVCIPIPGACPGYGAKKTADSNANRP